MSAVFHSPNERAAALLHAAHTLLDHLRRGLPLSTDRLRHALTAAFGADDTRGAWTWHDAYEASEAAVILFLRRFAPAMRRRAESPRAMVRMLERLCALEPSHTRRSEEQLARQQFSTPLPMAYAALRAARLRAGDLVLEPSAGTGMLAVFPQAAGMHLHLNELADTRFELLRRLFPDTPVTQHNAEHIRDLLPELRPSVVLLNPPFSRAAHVAGRQRHTDLRHLVSAYQMLPVGGRMVAITGHSTSPLSSVWQRVFSRLGRPPCVAFTCTVHGRLYRRRGTSFTTRITVLDRAHDSGRAGEPCADLRAENASELIEAIESVSLTRHTMAAAGRTVLSAHVRTKPEASASGSQRDSAGTARFGHVAPVSYAAAAPGEAHASDSAFDPWTPDCIRIAQAKEHPTALVQSAAMASIRAPQPRWQPLLPCAVVTEGILSEPQLESVVLAGEAHSRHLATEYAISDDWEKAEPVPAGSSAFAVRFRRGFALGDGTGAGKGRQVAAVILDNWLRGRRRAAWFSLSTKLVEDARRDWAALGGDPREIIDLSKIRQGHPIPHRAGVLFCTYATLRSPARGETPARLTQIIRWLAGSIEAEDRRAFDGCIVFDEAHAFAHATATKGARGLIAPSLQGLAGMRLQHALADARILYVSATGASSVDGFAYASRLGLWGGEDTTFATRSDFISSMTAGGVAAMEVIARDLKSLGRYQSRSLSYHGVVVDILEHSLTDAQTAIYDAYARAFGVIHRNVDAALEAAGVTQDGETFNPQAKSAARSAFESTKQRFFGHLLTSMKCPTLIAAIRDDLGAGRAAVVQLISTGEALLERRIADIPPAEWDDLSVDLTPREYVLGYLEHAFPTFLHELYSDEEGHVRSRPVFDADGRPVHCQEALAARDALIAHLASLPPVPSALDQIVHVFGHEGVAEITGRSRRVLRIENRLALRTRPASANLSEANAFQSDEKRILVFSIAGGTGRSYHADLDAINQRQRVHYLLEPGWRADTAIQGLGRTHRTHQACPPIFRPVTTNVKGERRFIATIAKRLDALGALTRGQRNAQSQGMFREEDNLESPYAHAALRQLYRAIYNDQVPAWSVALVEELTGLRLTHEGQLKEDLPPMSQFLNRLLALPIAQQNSLFTELETRIEANIESAKDAGTYNVGLETLVAHSFTLLERETVHTDAETGATTELVHIRRRDPLTPLPADSALALLSRSPDSGLACVAINARSGHAAVIVEAPGRVLDDGGIERRCRIVRPTRREPISLCALRASHWEPCEEHMWRQAWNAEIETLPAYVESELWMVCGLLLPIWHLMPSENMQIRRLTTVCGERLLGRVLEPGHVGEFRALFGLTLRPLAVEDVHQALIEHHKPFRLSQGWRLTVRLVMGRHRIELEGPTGDAIATAKSLGCHTEIISHRMRVFVPRDDLEVLARVLRHAPIVQSA